jgi:hypothetical protein
MSSFNDFEVLVLNHALRHAAVESSDVVLQFQQLLKEKGDSRDSYDVFNQTVVNLQKRGLLDEKNAPTAHAPVAVEPQVLQSTILGAHSTINELRQQLNLSQSETASLRNEAWKLREENKKLQGRIKYLCPPTKVISRESLEIGASQFLGNISNRISDVARNDLSNGVRCLYHGIHTAAAMVSLRASEDAVRRYYEFKTGQKVGSADWKFILDELLKRQDVRRSLVGHLDYVREKRNEAEHPDRIFDQDEAENTFLTVTNLIKEIYDEIPIAK